MPASDATAYPTWPAAVDHDADRVGGQRAFHAIVIGFFALALALSIADAADVLDVWGVDSNEVAASGAGPDGTVYELSVEAATVSRPGLATPLAIRVVASDPFNAPLTLAVSQDYLAMFDTNGFFPVPSAETADGDQVIYEFDPPPGDTFVLRYDARIEPAVQSGRSGFVRLLDDSGDPIASVEFTTRIRP
jgi:hypothetical protein